MHCSGTLLRVHLVATQEDFSHISFVVIQAYADENNLFFWETSAKTNVNVAEVFHDIAERLPRASAAPQPPQGGITLTETTPERPKKSSCCSS